MGHSRSGPTMQRNRTLKEPEESLSKEVGNKWRQPEVPLSKTKSDQPNVGRCSSQSRKDSSSQLTTMCSSSLGSGSQPTAEDWEKHFAAWPLTPQPNVGRCSSSSREDSSSQRTTMYCSSLGSSSQPTAEDWEEPFAARALKPQPVASELASSFFLPTTLAPSSHPGFELVIDDHLRLQQVSRSPFVTARVGTLGQSMLAPRGTGHERVLSDLSRFCRVNEEQVLTPRLASSLQRVNTCRLPGQHVMWSPGSGYRQ